MSSPESLTGVVAAHSPDGIERLRAERPGSHGTTRSVSLTDDCALRRLGLNLRIATQLPGLRLPRRRRSRWASLKAAATTSAGSSKTRPRASRIDGDGRRVQRPTSQE